MNTMKLCHEAITDLIAEVKIQMWYRFPDSDFELIGEKLAAIEKARKALAEIEKQETP